MLQSEFEQLTGRTVSESHYKEIEEIYMSCDMDKFNFCKLYNSISSIKE